MKIRAIILTFGGILMLAGLDGAATVALAQTAKAPPDPLVDLQNEAGAIVGANFRAPDPIVKDALRPGSPVLAAGEALRTSQQVPGAIFAGILKPFADADAASAPPPAPAAAPAPRPRRHARVHRHRVPAQG